MMRAGRNSDLATGPKRFENWEIHLRFSHSDYENWTNFPISRSTTAYNHVDSKELYGLRKPTIPADLSKSLTLTCPSSYLVRTSVKSSKLKQIVKKPPYSRHWQS